MDERSVETVDAPGTSIGATPALPLMRLRERIQNVLTRTHVPPPNSQRTRHEPQAFNFYFQKTWK